jgi:glycosyltransferase involved in cell wall biosynthesis
LPATGQPTSAPQTGRPRRRPRLIVYIFGQFPSISETFLLREMDALAALGLRVQPVALAAGPTHPMHPRAVPWVERGVLYRPPLASGASAAALARAAARYPAGWISALRMAAGLAWHWPSRARELAVSLAAAAYFATRLGGQARHIHATFASVPATVGLFLAELLGVSFSFACHARDLFTREASFLALKVREAEFVVVCSQVGHQYLWKQVPVRQRERLHLIRHGVELSRYVGRLRPLPRRPIIMSAGRLVPKKGFPYLLRAASLLVSRDLDFDLHIFGSGPQEAELRQLINGLQLADCVHLHGAVSETEMLAAYQQADLFVLASTQAPDGDNEGVPNVLVEALAMQVPVVATRSGGIPELIQHGVTGLLAQPGDPADLAAQMQRLLTDEPLRAQVAAAGRLKVEQEYDLHSNARQLAELFRSVAR